jgi:hypothetical protein
MTGLEAVTAVAKHINSAAPSVFGNKTGKVFKYEKEKGYKGEYIAVNNLPFIHRDAVQTATINVNVHVPKQPKTEQPDTTRLQQIVLAVKQLFDSEYGTLLAGAYFKYFSDSRPTLDNDDTYYCNIELDCTFSNVNSNET